MALPALGLSRASLARGTEVALTLMAVIAMALAAVFSF
jgi:hypothetical protein